MKLYDYTFLGQVPIYDDRIYFCSRCGVFLERQFGYRGKHSLFCKLISKLTCKEKVSVVKVGK